MDVVMWPTEDFDTGMKEPARSGDSGGADKDKGKALDGPISHWPKIAWPSPLPKGTGHPGREEDPVSLAFIEFEAKLPKYL